MFVEKQRKSRKVQKLGKLFEQMTFKKSTFFFVPNKQTNKPTATHATNSFPFQMRFSLSSEL